VNRMELDFVPQTSRRMVIGWLLLAFALVLLGLELFYLENSLQPETDRLTAQINSQSQALRPTRVVQRFKKEDLEAMVRAQKDVSTALYLPWPDLFQFMDRASSKNLGLLSLEPDTAKGQLIVTAEARNSDAMLGFYHNMSASPMFRDVSLQSHTVNDTDPDHPIRFRLRAQWVIGK